MNLPIDDAAIEKTVRSITEANGNDCRDRALQGVRCAASFWCEADGDQADFTEFCLRHFACDGEKKDELFARLEPVAETLYGSMHLIGKRLEWAVHVDQGPLLPVDDILSAWSPGAHISDDLYANKLAFVIHLNFPYRDLDRKIKEGPSWNRRQWAEARLGDMLSERVPADASQNLAAAFSAAQNYIAAYNIYPAALCDGDCAPLFPADKCLLMHWNMRDEIKAWYGRDRALRRQRLLYRAMERVVDGGIPLSAIDSADHPWDPSTLARAPEGDRRYQKLLNIFKAERGLDPWCPENPTLIARRFNVDREIPEKEVERLFHDLLSSPTFARTVKLVAAKVDRPLEAFDVWYRDFATQTKPDEAELDALTRERYPDARAFKTDIPRILRVLGFEGDVADWLAGRIEVDQARGSGHAMPAAMRSDTVRLRTRVPAGGMDYKGFNIACHELGHNVEQVFSLHGIDEYFLSGVPNTAFTEAFAFVFQARDMLILGRSDAPQEPTALADFWATCEIAGVALVDMELWRWMYEHPDCNAGELRQAALDISRSVWNRWFAPAFGFRDALVLGVYSHMIEHGMYLPDYPLGHIIAFQIEAAMQGKTVGSQMGRMCALGRLTPGQWMRQA
ncbi:MAG: hypothetical protein E4H20_02065, partial [Spirochaetales bacterium]